MNLRGLSAKPFTTELAWLFGSWAFSYLLVGVLLGYSSPQGYQLLWVSPLEIQMHNTYFVLDVFSATLPFFLLTALVVTSIRAFRGRNRRAALVTLGGLGLLVAAAITIVYLRFRA